MSKGFIIWWKALASGLVFLSASIFSLAYAYYWRAIDIGDVALALVPLGLGLVFLYASVEKQVVCKR